MSKFIQCSEKGIFQLKDNSGFISNDIINMDLVKSIYLYHFVEYGNYREYFAIGFTMLNDSDLRWYFLDEATRNDYLYKISSIMNFELI